MHSLGFCFLAGDVLHGKSKGRFKWSEPLFDTLDQCGAVLRFCVMNILHSIPLLR